VYLQCIHKKCLGIKNINGKRKKEESVKIHSKGNKTPANNVRKPMIKKNKAIGVPLLY